MSNYKHSILTTFVLLATFVFSHSAFATVTAVTPSPTRQNIAVNRTANVTIKWRVSVVTLMGGNNISTITSPLGNIYGPGGSDGPDLGRINTVVSRSVSNVNGTYTLTETIQIPVSIIYRARKLGFSYIRYERRFNDLSNLNQPISVLGSAIFDITGSSAAGFAINLISVRFDNGTAKRVIQTKKKLGIYAKISYTGVGMIKGVWEVADPSSSSGQAIYRPLRTVRRQQSGSGVTKLMGPKLPTSQTGIHLVRFRILEPLTAFNDPIIRYYVYNKGQRPQFAISKINVNGPDTGSSLEESTQFSWPKMENVRAYQLEIYADTKNPLLAQLPSLGDQRTSEAKIDGPLIAGMLLNGSRISTKIPASVRMKLTPGQWYVWRLVALSHKGKVIGISKPKKILVPSN